MSYLKAVLSTFFLLVFVYSSAQAGDSSYVTLDQAIAKVKKDKTHKILGAETIEFNGKTVHQIKILTQDGHVKKINVKTLKE
jgi:uncharacterized membrane protein YkoI|tara:strand:+ start:8726 stop:8971 length:246 start_codon:yes stop_codon:yes gene_type:complete